MAEAAIDACEAKHLPSVAVANALNKVLFTHADHGCVRRIPCACALFSHFWVGFHSPGPATWSRKRKIFFVLERETTYNNDKD